MKAITAMSLCKLVM